MCALVANQSFQNKLTFPIFFFFFTTPPQTLRLLKARGSHGRRKQNVQARQSVHGLGLPEDHVAQRSGLAVEHLQKIGRKTKGHEQASEFVSTRDSI